MAKYISDYINQDIGGAPIVNRGPAPARQPMPEVSRRAQLPVQAAPVGGVPTVPGQPKYYGTGYQHDVRETGEIAAGLAYQARTTLPFLLGASISVTQNGTGQATLRIPADMYYVATYVIGRSDDATPVFTVAFSLSSENQDIQTVALPFQLVLGDAEQPFPLPGPWVMPPNSTIGIDIVDGGSVGNHTTHVAFGGVRQRVYGEG